MKRFGSYVVLCLMLLLLSPLSAWAAGIHYMQCTACHKSSLAVDTLATANVCLSCHALGTIDPTPAPGWDGVIKGILFASQASDALGTNPYSPSGGGTSHIWGAPSNNPAAGAQEPATNLTGFYRRYQVSNGKVTCTRCHEPHADGATNPLAMPPDVRNANLPMKPEQMCRDCHVPFDQTNNKGLVTHPVVSDYGALLITTPYLPGGAKEGWLKTTIGNGSGSGTVQSITGTIYAGTAPATYANGVGCTSCHGVHAADSDSTTGDGFGTAADSATGDGKLLRSDGPTRTGGDSAATAQLRSNLCQACHTFKTHGNSGSQMGCLDCHSGHTVGSSNYFVLRNQVGATSGLNYFPLTAPVDDLWSGAPGDATGYCERCHGALLSMPGSARTHIENENCRTCHAHDGATFSFEAAGGCDGCHGAPPTTNTAGGPTGYAVSGAKNYSTASGGTLFKNEANTPHAAHAAGGTNYSFACNACHLNNSHDTGTFQDVFLGVDDPLATGSGQMSPAYNTANPGTCSAVYCHSNGGRRTGDGTRTYTAATIPGWNNGSTTGAISTCNACHDGAAEMDGVADRNSAAHAAHIARGYSCNVCHKDTASNNTTLAAGAIGGKHVNNFHDVVFDTSYSLGAGTMDTGAYPNPTQGTCAVYCHSDGSVLANADWDLPASGDCGACHGTAAVNPSSLSGGANGGHKIHIVDYATALSINCDDCHNHTGAFGGEHVDGTVEFRTDNCGSCHGSTAPNWGVNAVNNNCSACHGMAALDGSNNVIASATMKDTNGDTSNIDAQVGAHGVHLNSTRANIACATCHNTVVTNINAATGYVNKVAAAGHLGALPADITFSAIASTNTATPQYIGGTCSVTYCHDAAKIGKGMSVGLPGLIPVPDWDQASLFDGTVNDCNNCHGYPPGSTHTTSTDCSGCHANVVAADNAFVNENLHVNGIVEVQGGTNCGDCHAYSAGSAKGRISSGSHIAHTTVVDGVIANEDFSDCAACHGATVTSYDYAPGGNHMNGTTDFVGGLGYNDNGTRGNLADDTVTNCAGACHAMANGQAAVWTATSLSCDACHANPPATGGNDDLGHSKHLALSGVTCATCHDATVPTDAAHANNATGTEGTILANRAVAEPDEASLLIAGFNDTDNTCNNAACHNPTGGAYAADWDDDISACNLCHGNAPTSGAHAAHTTVSVNTTSEDRSDCALCHVGAATYTYAHRNGASAFVAGMANGGTDPNYTCTAACHTSTVGDGSWVDANSALNCNACHGNPPVNGGGNGTAHVDHLSAGLTCASCHDSGGVPADTTHISIPTGTDGQKITDKATADAAEVQIDVPTWNATNNTCANVACHNPSGTSYLADWDTSISNCTLCHSNTNPGTGSHTPHISLNTTIFNINGQAACADCHTIPGANSHLNGVVNVNGAKITTWTDPTCTTSCHSNGIATVPTPNWGTVSPNCTICHNGPPATGDHVAHFSAGRITAGMTCNSCHSGTSADSTHAAGAGHMNGNRYNITAGGSYTGTGPVTISSYLQGSPSSCTANCHSSNPKLWEVPSTCEGCHGNLTADSTHAAHITITPTIATDLTECASCHGATVTTYTINPGGNHQNGSMNFAAGIANGGTSPNYTCSAACHSTTAGQAVLWSATSLGCDTCHGNPPPTGGGDTTAHADHIAAGLTCATCHDSAGVPTDLTHISAPTGTEGQQLTDRAVAEAAEVLIMAANWDGIEKTCSNIACHDPTGDAYLADWDVDISSCLLCHDNAPATGAHAAHTIVSGHTLGEDRSDCALCHEGAASYTYAHRDGANTFVPGLGYNNNATPANPNDDTCTGACHTSTAVNGFWGDIDLGCTACHGNPPVNGGGNGTAHVDHLSAGLTCASCHDSGGVPSDTTHISIPTGTDGQKITDKATAEAAEVQIDVPTWNGINNTCANVACHNPSPGASYAADWTAVTGSVSSCTLCHANANATMVSGSHAQHLGVSVPTTFNVSATCATCHGAVPGSNAHRNGTVNLAVTGGTGYSGIVTDTTNTTWGTCSITQCHNTGDTTTPRVTPQWGRTPQSSDNCTICHNGAPAPATGDHSAHFSAGRVTAGMSCNSCHSGSASNNTTAGGSGHLNNARYDVSAGGSYTGTGTVTISSYLQGAPSSCTANCHSSNPKLWEVPSTCEGCHSNLAADTTHAAHITITPSIINDTTDCQQCHGVAVASYTVSGGHANHQVNGTIDFAAGIANGGTSPNYTCSAACHSTTAGQAVLWSATSLGCDTCHGNPPPTGGGDTTAHADHIAAGLTCGTCHDTTLGTPTDLTHISAPTGTEGQQLIDRAVAEAAEVLIMAATWNGTNKTCNNTACHNPSGTTYFADWTATTGSVSDCALCHAGLSDDPGTGSHTSHRTASTIYGNDATCAECHVVTGDTAHRDGTVNVNGSKITAWTDLTCTTSCHSNGIAATGPTPNWGTEASSCSLCHSASPTSGSHNKHLLRGNYVSGCGACHTGANNTAHINGSKSFIAGITYASASGTCSTNVCHSGSADWRDNVPTIQCVDCHNADGNPADLGSHTLDQGNWPPSSFAHTGHLNSNPLGGSGNNAQNDCYACHGNTINSSGAIIGTGHLNQSAGDLAFSSTTFRYQGVAITTGGSAGTARTCSNARCHNGVTTPTWGSGTISCGDCHGDAATNDPEPQGADETATIGSHGLHTDATVGSYTDCANCHGATVATNYTAKSSQGGQATHQNLQVEIVPGTGTYSEATAGVANLTGAGINYGGDFADNGTCATVSCHYNALTPAWGTAASAYPGRCDNCHNDGVTSADDNTLAGAVPSTSDGVHKRHVNAINAYVLNDCNACHGANAINGTHTGHGNAVTSYGNSLTGYSAGACASNLCHNDAAGNLWTDSATLACNDCHNATGKTLYVSGALTATTPPNTGKHAIHDASTLTELAAGCNACHPHAGSFAIASHADGGSTDLTSNIDLGGSISSPLETQTGWAGTCTNSCHSAGVADDNWSTGTLECTDCHSGGLIGGNHLTNGQHSKHNVSYSASYTTAAANNSTVGAYDYNCANCHGNTIGNHKNNTVQVSGVGYAGAGSTCNATYCHSDGVSPTPSYKVAPNWVGGSFTGDRCDECHGNSPTTAAHGVHVVGIHASDVSSGAVGKLTAGSVQASAHGNSTTSTTINCNICHSSVVTMARNKLGTACVSCHTGDANNTTNIMDVANKQLHVNGTKQVVFAMTAFKSKAQLRDDITTVPELNDNWTRTNGYKAAASFDQAKVTPAPNWNGTTCSTVDCHNGIQATWQTPAGDCSACHTALPK